MESMTWRVEWTMVNGGEPLHVVHFATVYVDMFLLRLYDMWVLRDRRARLASVLCVFFLPV